jgi:hypothetical protein
MRVTPFDLTLSGDATVGEQTGASWYCWPRDQEKRQDQEGSNHAQVYGLEAKGSRSKSKTKKDPTMHKDEVKDKVVGKRGESTQRIQTETKIIKSRKGVSIRGGVPSRGREGYQVLKGRQLRIRNVAEWMGHSCV